MADRQGADRGKAVEAALANIEKKFGKGSIMRLGDKEVIDIPAISTTSLSLDACIGVGGIPRGRARSAATLTPPPARLKTAAEAALDLKGRLSYIVPASGRISGFIPARVKKYLLQV